MTFVVFRMSLNQVLIYRRSTLRTNPQSFPAQVRAAYRYQFSEYDKGCLNNS